MVVYIHYMLMVSGERVRLQKRDRGRKCGGSEQVKQRSQVRSRDGATCELLLPS